MDKNTFELIKSKYGLHASWAIWGEEGNTPKSNMDDLSFFEEDQILSKLNPNIVLVGLNFSVSGVVLNPFQNFHGQGGGAFKIRYALKNTAFWGAYMTDIIKDFPEKESHNVMKYLRNNSDFIDKNIISFEEELKDIKADDPTILGFGNDSYDILQTNLGSKYNIIKAMHYSHYISKENYREHMIGVIDDWNNNKHKT